MTRKKGYDNARAMAQNENKKPPATVVDHANKRQPRPTEQCAQIHGHIYTHCMVLQKTTPLQTENLASVPGHLWILVIVATCGSRYTTRPSCLLLRVQEDTAATPNRNWNSRAAPSRASNPGHSSHAPRSLAASKT